MNGERATQRTIPFTDREPGEDCGECGKTIRPDTDTRQCHSCRVRPHKDLVDDIVDQLTDSIEDHSTRMSVVLAVRKRMFTELRGGSR